VHYHGAKSTSCKKSKIRAEVDVQDGVTLQMSSYGDKIIKFGGNVNDRCGNLTKKTELKSADLEHHLVISGTF